MKILLCNPRNSQGFSHSRKGMYVPLGLLSIATVLKQQFKDEIQIEIMDEDIESVDIEKFKYFDIIGFYSTTFNYQTAIYYAKLAKLYGAITLLGGPHASVMAKNIISNQNCFDFIICYEGEKPITLLIDKLIKKDNNYISIPNLVYKEGREIKFYSKLHENNLENLPIPSREFIPFNKYITNFQKVYQEKKDIVPGSIYSSKGCSWRDKTQGCVFCARLEKGVRFRSIQQIWEEIKIIKNRYNVNSIWDISDDNLNNIEWFKEFVKKRPNECSDMRFFIYSRTNLINEKIINYLKELNVDEVFIGIESGDNDILKRTFKGQSTNTILKAVKLLKKHEIKYFPSFVFGLPGETDKSMNNTYNLCQELLDIGGLDRIGCSILMPMPGSISYDLLLNKTEAGEKLKNFDEIDIILAQKLWIKHFTKINYDDIQNWIGKINYLLKDLNVFGSEED